MSLSFFRNILICVSFISFPISLHAALIELQPDNSVNHPVFGAETQCDENRLCYSKILYTNGVLDDMPQARAQQACAEMGADLPTVEQVLKTANTNPQILRNLISSRLPNAGWIWTKSSWQHEAPHNNQTAELIRERFAYAYCILCGHAPPSDKLTKRGVVCVVQM